MLAQQQHSNSTAQHYNAQRTPYLNSFVLLYLNN